MAGAKNAKPALKAAALSGVSLNKWAEQALRAASRKAGGPRAA